MHAKSPKQEVEELMDDVLPLAKKMLEEYGEFYPYGGYMDQNHRITHVGAQFEGTDMPKSEALINLLRERFREEVKKRNYKATAVVFAVRIPPPGGNEKTDAIQICLDHHSGYSAEVFFPYQIRGNKEVIYGQVFAQKGDGLIFI
jgi:hypothetical protein